MMERSHQVKIGEKTTLHRKEPVFLPAKNTLVVFAEKPRGQCADDSDQGGEGVRRAAENGPNIDDLPGPAKELGFLKFYSKCKMGVKCSVIHFDPVTI